jgi:serine/threonine protein kinase
VYINMSIESQHSLNTQSSLDITSILNRSLYSNDMQSGGAAHIEQGGHSCVVKHIPCIEETVPSGDKLSKIVSSDKSEWDHVTKWLNTIAIEWKKEYLLLPDHKCDKNMNMSGFLERITDKYSEDYHCVANMLEDKKIAREDDDLANIIMEYGGQTLTQYRLAGGKNKNCRELSIVYLQILTGLAVLQHGNIAHRDIKRTNITIGVRDKDYKAKIIDFGLIEKIDKSGTCSDWYSTPNHKYQYWPSDLLIINKTQSPVKYNEHQGRILSNSHRRDQKYTCIVIAWEIIYDWYINIHKPWATDTDVILKLWSSLTQFLMKLHVTKEYSLRNTVICDKIKSTWDVFMMGTLLAEELNIRKPPHSDSNDTAFHTQLKTLVLEMVSLNPMERISLKDAIYRFIVIMDDTGISVADKDKLFPIVGHLGEIGYKIPDLLNI